ncbi:hypothetical protein EMCRGX_G011180 [Ephydatia muelleri]
MSRDFKGWAQMCLYVLGPYLNEGDCEVLLAFTKVFQIAYCDIFQPSSADSCRNVCHAFVDSAKCHMPTLLEKQKTYLLHFVDCMIQFGPSSAFSAESRLMPMFRHIFGNRLAPSRDIAQRFSTLQHLRYIRSDGVGANERCGIDLKHRTIYQQGAPRKVSRCLCTLSALHLVSVGRQNTTLDILLQCGIHYDLVLGSVTLAERVTESGAVMSQERKLVNSGDFIEVVTSQFENKAKARERYKADPEKKKASVRDTYKADPEKKKASVRDTYNANAVSKRAAKRQRYQEGVEENRAAKRQRYQEGVEENRAAKRRIYRGNSATIKAARRSRYWKGRRTTTTTQSYSLFEPNSRTLAEYGVRLEKAILRDSELLSEVNNAFCNSHPFAQKVVTRSARAAVSKISADALLAKALSVQRSQAGSLLNTIQEVNALKLEENDILVRHGYHTAGSLPPWPLDTVLPPLSSATSSSSSAAPTPTTSSSRAAPTTSSSRAAPTASSSRATATSRGRSIATCTSPTTGTSSIDTSAPTTTSPAAPLAAATTTHMAPTARTRPPRP